MKRNSESKAVIIGVIILSLTFLGLAGVTYSFYQNDVVGESDSDDFSETKEDDPLEQLKREKNLDITPTAEQEESGMGTLEPEPGIPTGTYSNPPTTIDSFDDSEPTTPTTNRPIENFDSSVERNRRIQSTFGNTTPDYSRPSSSNDFNDTSENSLIEPLENDAPLDSFSTDDDESVITPSLTESPLEN